MDIHFIQVPYDSSRYSERMGKGSGHIMQSGISSYLTDKGHTVTQESVMSESPFPAEISTGFELIRKVSKKVEALDRGQFPIVLSGNCNITAGTIAGLNKSRLGMLWFDAHGDCETPETSTSGFMDGMGLAIAMGCCWKNALKLKSESFPLPGVNIALIGARELSTSEQALVAEAGVHHLSAEEIHRTGQNLTARSLAALINNGVTALHVHIDADVLDPSIGKANSYAMENGLFPEEVAEIIRLYNRFIPVCSLGIASYDPSFDTDGSVLKFIRMVIETTVSLRSGASGK
jgi:arginase